MNASPKKRVSTYTVDVAMRGTTFLDIVLSDLEGRPRAGTEVWAREMEWTPGGVATSAVAATRLGLTVAVDTRLGTDHPGSICSNFLQSEGVSLAAVGLAPSTPVTVSIAEGGDRTMITREDREKSGPTMGPLPPARAIIAQGRYGNWWRGTSSLVVADVSHDPEGLWDLDDLAGRLEGASVITPNRDEALAYTGKNDIRAAAETLAEMFPSVIITDGPNGAFVLESGELHHVPAIDVDAVDPTGAGDVFLVGITYALLQSWTLLEAVRFAVAVSGLSTTKLGGSAGAPSLLELRTWIDSADLTTKERYGFLVDHLPRRAEATT